MAEWLKQSTAITVKIGPFVDDTDGKTAETALTISQADVRLSKNGGNFAQKSDATAATHDENGYYGVPLNTTDTNTLGRLIIAVSESGALPVWKEYMVVPANVWDSMFSTDRLQVHTAEMSIGLITASVFDESTAFPLKAADAGTTYVARTGADGDTLEKLSDEIAVVDGVVDAILVDTAVIGAAGAGLTNVPWNASWGAEVQSEATNALNAYDPPTNAEMVARTLAAAAYFDPAADTVTVGTNNDKTGYALTEAAIDAILDEVVDGTFTMRQLLRGFATVLMGKASGGGTTTIVMRDLGDTKNRLTFTVDTSGNRSAVTRDLA